MGMARKAMTQIGSRVIIGMSGGVDSSVAALLLQRRGLEVSGLFMKNWEESDSSGLCPAAVDARDAMAVCERIGIDFDAVNFSREYWDRVFAHFLEEYRRGHTPNPDVLCNKEIKFRAFLDYALSNGAEAIATGHYARVRKRRGRFELLKGRDPDKDQSYFLYTLGQEQLSRVLFPVGELHKVEVRRLALAARFPNHAKKDSTGICFIGERRFREFLGTFLRTQPGEIRTLEGRCIGSHEGLMFHTLGQRKGLGIGGRRNGSGGAWYVVDKDPEHNVLYVAQGHDHPRLFSRELRATQLHWIAGEGPDLPLRCAAKTRYRQTDQACTVLPGPNGGEGDRCLVRFDRPQRAMTPGQSVVFYHDETCIGGGVSEAVDAAAMATPEPRYGTA